MFTSLYAHKPTSTPKPITEKRTSTRVTYTGQGQKMDLDAAWAKGICFRCGKPGHMSKNCPDKGKFVTELTEDEKKEMVQTLKRRVLQDSTVIMARLSQTWTDNVT